MDIYTVASQMKTERKSIFDLKLRVTYYARVSTTTEIQENSIENQISFFEDMIKQNSNWEYVEGYVDRIRGESAENRENFMRMVNDGKQGKFDLILTKEVSRFARNTIDSLTYTRDLLRAGVGVFFQNDNICTIDTDSEFRLTIMSSMAADEVRKLSERVKFGHKKAIENGHVLGNNRIFGYDKHNCVLTINEKEAEMVRLIFELYSTEQYSVKKIEQIIFERGYRGRNGTRIHHNTISGIIQNPKYKGYFCGNKVKTIDFRTKEQRFLPEEEWIMYKDDNVPAIVSEEIWDKCNKLFKERSEIVKNKGRSLKDKSILTGKIYCTEHNMPYWRTSYSNSTSKGKPIYQWLCCEKKKFKSEDCKSFSIMEEDLYKMLFCCFKDLSSNIDGYIKSFVQIYNETNQSKSLQKEIDDLTIKCNKEKIKKEKLLDLYTDEIISKKEFMERNNTLAVSISEMENDLRKIKEQQKNTNNVINELKEVEKFIKNHDMDNITVEQSHEVIKILVDKIYVTPVDGSSMNIEIRLKTKSSNSFMYERDSRSSGRIFKKMIPERQFKFDRIDRRAFRHKREVLFLVSIGF